MSASLNVFLCYFFDPSSCKEIGRSFPTIPPLTNQLIRRKVTEARSVSSNAFQLFGSIIIIHERRWDDADGSFCILSSDCLMNAISKLRRENLRRTKRDYLDKWMNNLQAAPNQMNRTSKAIYFHVFRLNECSSGSWGKNQTFVFNTTTLHSSIHANNQPPTEKQPPTINPTNLIASLSIETVQ